MLYARAITLRNCGRFTVVASDFGSEYRTHTHVTSEALYASLTRGATWRPHVVNLKDDPYDFTRTYNVDEMPIWFLPGIFVAEESHRLPDAYLDTTAFNVVQEFYPSTSLTYLFKKGDLLEKDRPYQVPTYGTIQAIKPDQRLATCAFSPKRAILDGFTEGQTFILGKKRPMFQIVDLSHVVEGVWRAGQCQTWWLQVPPDGGKRFSGFEVIAATIRYLILKGITRESVGYIEFSFSDKTICLPDFYLDWTPLRNAITRAPAVQVEADSDI